MTTALYRMHDADGALLYVGITDHLADRWGKHEATQSWWGQVATATVEHFPTRTAAVEAELHAIRTERPMHNVAGRIAKRPNPELLADITAQVLRPSQAADVLGCDTSTIRRWVRHGECPDAFADLPTERVGIPRWWIERHLGLEVSAL